jgi:hypothetical protein
MIGTHQSMPSLNPPLPLNISKSAVSMFLSAVPNTARERGTVARSVVTLTRVMPSLRVTFGSMPEHVGGWRPWPPLMILEISVKLLRH